MALLEDEVAAVRKIDIVPTILDTVCRLTGMGFSAIARVSEERWVACAVLDKIDFGLPPGGELKLETTICYEIRESRVGVIISDIETDPVYRDHHTPAMYGFRSYISIPIIRSDQSVFGTLCAIDPSPHDLTRPEIQATFRMFAELLAFHLDTLERLAASEDKLASEVATGELREQFIAVLGHDLRNPLSAVGAGMNMLRRGLDPTRATAVLNQMQDSVKRMSWMIDNILDFARGRLGGGLPLDLKAVDIGMIVQHGVAELAASHPDRRIDLVCDPGPFMVECDAHRIGQLLSNLLGNALTHGSETEPITVTYRETAGLFQLSVSNSGEKIPPEARARLFHPFARGAASMGREGLGLGLYIASEIAKAHGGRLSVISTSEQTSFIFDAPLTTHA